MKKENSTDEIIPSNEKNVSIEETPVATEADLNIYGEMTFNNQEKNEINEFFGRNVIWQKGKVLI